MEHLLIQGDGSEIYLPFARSRVRALLALGLPYADQSFEVEGVSIKVRIEPGHEYIRIEGGNSALKMDSGIVKIDRISEFEPSQPWDYQPEPLYETDALKAYNSAFSPNADTGWRKNPASTNSGQIAGDITLSGKKLRGKTPKDGVTARSFTPEMIFDTDLGKWKASTNDEVLWAKKQQALLCPPSIFTGKCRLWVQAMYGLPTRNSTTNGYGETLSDSGPAVIVGSGATLGSPTLMVPKRKVKDDTSTLPGVTITTSAGVMLDTMTGRHWLIELGLGVGAAYPLYSDVAGEKARKLLISGADTGGLTAIELEHLEAYVLATSRPDLTKAQRMDLGLVVHGYSMGYGWHWNWDGTAADIVHNINGKVMEFGDGSWGEGVTSSHYRTTVSITGDIDDRALFASTTLIEGPVDWAMPRLLWTIAEVDWGTRQNTKTTPHGGRPTVGNAPFYAFYKRNELQVCRAKTEYIPGVPGVRESSVDVGFKFCSTGFDETFEGLTVGMRGGWMTDTVTAAKYICTLSCGDSFVSGALTQGATSTERIWVTEKTVQTTSTPYTIQIQPTEADYAAGCDVPTGYPLEGSNGDPPKKHYDNAAFMLGSPSYETFTKYYRVESSSESSLLTAIVPLLDAEAIYLHGETKATTNYGPGTTEQPMQSAVIDTYFLIRPAYGWRPVGDGTFVWGLVGYVYGDEKVYAYTLTNYFGWAALGPEATSPTPEDVSQVTDEKLVCIAGDVLATLGDLTNYHGPEDECSPSFFARSGVRVDSAVAISDGRITPAGTTIDGKYAVLVGYV